MAFVREHWRPLTGAAGLHIGLLALLAFAAWQWPRSQPPVSSPSKAWSSTRTMCLPHATVRKRLRLP
jgi:hypothetical protein